LTNTNEEEVRIDTACELSPKDWWKWAYIAMHTVKFKRVHPDAVIPERQREGDACYDLCSIEHVNLIPGATWAVDTGLQMEMPIYLEARIRPRGGLALHHGIVPVPGTIDSGYRGNIKVIFVNNSQRDMEIRKGDRVAQMSFHGRCHVTFEVVEELNDTERGEGGFGSTGQ
jgi:dUTP pyrophosphatase